MQAVERIALLEGVTDEGLFLLKTAAILHDAGFVEQYENNESIGAQMAVSLRGFDIAIYPIKYP